LFELKGIIGAVSYAVSMSSFVDSTDTAQQKEATTAAAGSTNDHPIVKDIKGMVRETS
jgi:hypothetical protein